MRPRSVGRRLFAGLAVCAIVGLAIAEVDATVYNLSVTKIGAGSGTVSSAPAAIDCGSVCTASIDRGTIVTLVAAPDTGSVFTGWSGDDCSGLKTCKLRMGASKSVTAAFEPEIGLPGQTARLTLQKSSGGRVVANGVSYESNAVVSYGIGTKVTLSAEPALGYVFDGWSGACTGQNSCVVRMVTDETVAATFVPVDSGATSYTLSIAKAGFGYGTVTSIPQGIDCGVTCGASIAANTLVTLVANPAAGSTFAGWTGACSGTGACEIRMHASASVTAKFDGSSPGSILLFPIYTSIEGDTEHQDTVIRVTNTHPSQAAMIHVFLVAGETGAAADAFLLVPGQTFTFNLSDWDLGVTGCILFVAVDSNGIPVNFNYLTAQYDIRLASGHQGNNLDAKAIRALRTVARDPAAQTADLKFNGLDYEFLPKTLLATNLPSVADGNDTKIIVSRLGGNLMNVMAPLGALAGVLCSQAMTAYGWTTSIAAPAVQTIQTLSSTFPGTNPSYLDIVAAGQTGTMEVWGMPQNTKGIFGISLNHNSLTQTTDACNLDIAEQLTEEVTITMPVFVPPI